MHVYFAVIPGFEQGTSDSLILTDVALDQFCEDFPLASRVYIKSDNPGSYYRNCCFEVLYSIDIADLQNKNITLLRYDYNEHCCGKDQCNRESAAAKSLLISFVDAGNITTRKWYL